MRIQYNIKVQSLEPRYRKPRESIGAEATVISFEFNTKANIKDQKYSSLSVDWCFFTYVGKWGDERFVVDANNSEIIYRLCQFLFNVKAY